MTTGEELLARLWKHFQQDPLIDEIGLLFNIEQSDLTPDNAFFLENHKLGVAFAASVSLFQAARRNFHPLNVLLQQEAVEMTQSKDSELRAQLLHCTRAILLISADFYTAWNTRKYFVTRGWLDAQDEVQFTNLVFTLHPKSIDTWAYRRWLAIRLCQSLSEDELRLFYEQQIEVSNRLAEMKPRNYHAWSFRHWIVSRLPLDLTLKELITMERWCKTHITDHSGWNHRQHTLNELAKKYQDAGGDAECLQNLILAEFKFVSEVMATYPTYEALWCHRRSMMQRLLQQVSRRAISDLSLVLVLISQVRGSLLDTNQEFFGAAALRLSWGETIKMLSSGSFDMSFGIHAVLREIEAAWRCGNQFSRHYAAWCLARLRIFFRGRHTGVNVQDEALGHELSSLASILHEQSVHEARELDGLLSRML